jgi:hypothetical protein
VLSNGERGESSGHELRSLETYGPIGQFAYGIILAGAGLILGFLVLAYLFVVG